MWILWKMRLWKCEFCENWDFRIVNFVKNETSEMWILWKMRFQKGEFCKNWDFQCVNFWIKCGFLPQCVRYGDVSDSEHLVDYLWHEDPNSKVSSFVFFNSYLMVCGMMMIMMMVMILLPIEWKCSSQRFPTSEIGRLWNSGRKSPAKCCMIAGHALSLGWPS